MAEELSKQMAALRSEMAELRGELSLAKEARDQGPAFRHSQEVAALRSQLAGAKDSAEQAREWHCITFKY